MPEMQREERGQFGIQLQTNCAWCHPNQNKAPLKNPMSHTICELHLYLLRLQIGTERAVLSCKNDLQHVISKHESI